jgi:hypothetical protein
MDTAKLLIQQAPLDADTRRTLSIVCDDVWASMEPRFAGHPAKLYGPMTIVNSVLNRATAGERDPTALNPDAQDAADD